MLLTSLVSALLCVTPVGAPAAVDPLGRGAWFVDTTNDEVLLAHPKNGVKRFACRWPSQVVIDSHGTAYAACRGEGTVRRLTEPAATWAAGPEPRALALDENAGSLYVALATSDEVVVLSTATGAPARRFTTAFEPTAIALFDGALVVGSRRSGRVQRFALDTPAAPSDLPLATVAEDTALGIEHFVTKGDALIAVAANATLGSLDLPSYYEGAEGSPVAEQLYTLDAGAKAWRRVSARTRIGDVASAHWLEGSQRLVLASRGSGQVVEYDLSTSTKRARQAGKRRSFGAGLIAYVDDGAQAYAFDDVARTIQVTEGNKRTLLATLDAPKSKWDAELDRGRQLFHVANDRHVSASGLACASCHADGRDDGRTWVGQGAMRQTPMLAGRALAQTAPYGWSGKYPTLEQYIAFTIETRLRGKGLPEADLKALARYLREGLPDVQRAVAAPNEAVARGSALFHGDAVNCASCHPSDGAFTDGANHDVGSLSAAEVDAEALRLMTETPLEPGLRSLGAFDISGLSTRAAPTRATPRWRKKVDRTLDTPSLLQVGLTAPYLHDGSAKTLDEVFSHLQDHMGSVSTLSARERADLIAYVQTL